MSKLVNKDAADALRKIADQIEAGQKEVTFMHYNVGSNPGPQDGAFMTYEPNGEYNLSLELRDKR